MRNLRDPHGSNPDINEMNPSDIISYYVYNYGVYREYVYIYVCMHICMYICMYMCRLVLKNMNVNQIALTSKYPWLAFDVKISYRKELGTHPALASKSPNEIHGALKGFQRMGDVDPSVLGVKLQLLLAQPWASHVRLQC